MPTTDNLPRIHKRIDRCAQLDIRLISAKVSVATLKPQRITPIGRSEDSKI